MGRNTSVILGNHFDTFIKSEMESGRYGSVSEIIRAGLRLLEDEKQRNEAINQALAIGEQIESPKKFDLETFKQKMQKKLGVIE